MNMVGHPKHAVKALDLGVDIVCAQGGEGGGVVGGGVVPLPEPEPEVDPEPPTELVDVAAATPNFMAGLPASTAPTSGPAPT